LSRQPSNRAIDFDRQLVGQDLAHGDAQDQMSRVEIDHIVHGWKQSDILAPNSQMQKVSGRLRQLLCADGP
jgi:hypothetical protein